MRFLYKSTLLTDTEIQKTAQTLSDYVVHLQQVIKQGSYGAAESSINLPSDQELYTTVEMFKKDTVTPKLKYIFDIGIGGSNLGTKAVYDALHGYFDPLEPDRAPKIFFFDTNAPEMLARLEEFIKRITSSDEILVNMISKSGGTTETVVNFEIIYSLLVNKFPDIQKRVVVTTDHGSKLWIEAQKRGFRLLPIPKQVGGRYSILSAVGLYPLAAAGINIQALLSGAIDMRTVCTFGDAASNPALMSASILYLHASQGKRINDNFFFNPQFESLGKWYRQLMGESIGKEEDLQGTVVNAGITPTVSIGSVDLHSVAQLYLGGPKDKVTTFVHVQNTSQDAVVPQDMIFPTLVDHIKGKSAFEIMGAIYEGVKAAYTKKQLPFMELQMEDISEHEIGQFLQFKMMEMMYLGKLFNINTFDQPQVELYKTETKRILSSET